MINTIDWFCPICKSSNRTNADEPFGTCMICLSDIDWFDIRIYNSPEFRYVVRELQNGRFENACQICGHTVSADYCYYCDVPIPQD